MLPDYTELKEELNSIVFEFFVARVRAYGGIVNEVSKTKIFEGDKHAIQRGGSEKEELEFKESGVEFELSYSEIPTMSLQDVLTKLDIAAKEMATGTEKGMLSVLSSQLKKHGREFDNKGKKFTPETILEILDGMMIEFSPNGQPKLPTIVAGEEALPKIQEAWDLLIKDDSLRARFEKLILEKKTQWNAEQASRKLVG